MNPATVATGLGNPQTVTVDPTGRYAYVTSPSQNVVLLYTIDSGGGGLTPSSSGTVATGVFPSALAIDSTGHFAYVANQGDNTVSQFVIGIGGVLTPLNPALVTTGSHPLSITTTF